MKRKPPCADLRRVLAAIGELARMAPCEPKLANQAAAIVGSIWALGEMGGQGKVSSEALLLTAEQAVSRHRVAISEANRS